MVRIIGHFEVIDSENKKDTGYKKLNFGGELMILV